jgi:sigma-B regulation protein RsbU (phosphoserine phosphatase)
MDMMPRTADTQTRPARPLRALLADDQQDVLIALSFLLKSEGWVTTSVTTPDDLLQALRSGSYDAVLMDLNYKRDTTSGEEGMELLRQIEDLADAPPVIVMTAWGSIELAVEAMRRGARDFVIKPWDNQKLVETLRRHAGVEAKPRREERSDRYSRNELEVASRVQQKLLPERGRELERLEMAGHCLPAGAVGGDSFDFIDLNPSRLVFVLADVSGKGLPAALMMANLQAILRSGAPRAVEDMRGFVALANRQFHESTQFQHYATLFLGDYDDSRRRLRYVNCGHPPAILVRSDSTVERLTSTTTALGLFEDLDSEVGEATIFQGDTLVVFSDGVVEAVRAEGDELGENRLIEMLGNLVDDAKVPLSDLPQALLEEILEVSSYRQTDDMTLIVARGH